MCSGVALGATLASGVWRSSTAAIWYLGHIFRLFPPFVASSYLPVPTPLLSRPVDPGSHPAASMHVHIHPVGMS